MLIDWFTVGAQVLNFLILVWLLKRFLYKPILDALDAREQRIADELADAATKQSEAESERDEFREKNEEFNRRRDEMLSKARDEAGAEHQRLLDEARKDADAMRAKRREALRREQQSLVERVARQAQEEVFAIARKTLADLAGASLEERMGEMFARRLRALDGPAKKELARALKSPSDPVLVRSAFELPPEQRGAIRDALRDSLSADTEVRFETAPAVISGVELIANGRKVAWSIADYLESLEKTVGGPLPEPAESKGATEDAQEGVAAAGAESGNRAAAGEEAR
ncbi:MAG: F0F1 ATP synthase subunit B [Thermoguttaceae bacterium]|jgi:F-type H+-transporting ATPase subunit b|nr:F0F1 ATP synthase subunit B [Thermoguttaceae bacterium]